MSKECKRDFKVNQTVYLVDYWGTNNGTQAFEAEAKILQVDEENKTFDAVLYGDTYKRYSFEDYGRLIFDTAKEANEAAGKLPKPKSVVYQKIGKRVYKKMVSGINEHYVDNVYDLIIRLNKGKDVSTKEIGISIFLNESDARQ
ncbi:MAG TPA: hypothetical protein OIM60_05775 [Clostridiaceae bacterium]|nr:hypothetical protein [Clostridiaceae bacterium]